MFKEINDAKQQIRKLEKWAWQQSQLGHRYDQVDYLIQMDWLRGYLYMLEKERQQTVNHLRQNLEKNRNRRIELGQARQLLPRSNQMGIDERFLHIGHLLADWGFSPRKLLIRYGCTDKDITQWKTDKLIVPVQNAYRPTPYAQSATVVTSYSLTQKGQAYLRQHHFIWNDQLEEIYHQALKQQKIEPIFTKPSMNMVAPQSANFEHNIAALTAAIYYQEQNPHVTIFGPALIRSKINHVLGLPIPRNKDAWQYDAILCALPETVEEINHNLHYYRHWVAQLTEERDRKLAEIDQEMKGTLQYFLDYPDDHYYYCIKHGQSLDEEPNKIRCQAQKKKDAVHQNYEQAITKQKNQKRAIVLEYERSYKNNRETDNFIFKLDALSESDAWAMVLFPSEKRLDNFQTKMNQRYTSGTIKKWERGITHGDYGYEIGWRSREYHLDENDHIIFDVWDSDNINDIAGFSFRKKKKTSKTST